MSHHIEKCPWCSGPASVQVISDDDWHYHNKLCSVMGIANPGRIRVMAAFVECDNHECQASGPFLDSEEQAVEAWNRVAVQSRQR